MVALDICDYQNVSQIFFILFSLGKHRGYVELGPNIGKFEEPMGVTVE